MYVGTNMFIVCTCKSSLKSLALAFSKPFQVLTYSYPIQAFLCPTIPPKSLKCIAKLTYYLKMPEQWNCSSFFKRTSDLHLHQNWLNLPKWLLHDCMPFIHVCTVSLLPECSYFHTILNQLQTKRRSPRLFRTLT